MVTGVWEKWEWSLSWVWVVAATFSFGEDPFMRQDDGSEFQASLR